MTPTLVVHEGMLVLGIDVRTSNAAEADPARAQVPALWARFRRENILGQLPGKSLPVLPVGVYTDYENDHRGPFRLVAGAAVQEEIHPPKGLARAVVRGGAYLVFSGEGPMPNAVIEAWQSVWEFFSKPSGHVRAYTTDFEVYRGPTMVDIYIALK